ncbi:MAG: dockerin type I domain-containing protein [Patescibacteria group bacterium]
MKKINLSKALNIASVAVFAISMTVLGLFLAPKSTSAQVASPWTGCFPDFNNDGNVNLSDFGFFGTHYPSVENGSGNYDALADVNGDGNVDSFDRAIFEIYSNKPFAGCPNVPNFNTLCPDYDNSGVVDLSDLSYFSAYKTENNTGEADFDQDGDVDEFDAAIFEVYYNTNYVCVVPVGTGVSTPVEPILDCFPNFVETNESNSVDLSDFSWFVSHYPSEINVAGNYHALADFDGDGYVNDYDLAVFNLYFHKSFTCDESRLIDFVGLCPDFNGDYKVNLSDLSFFSEYMAGQNSLADFDRSGVVDENDKAIFELYYNTDFVCQSYEFLKPQGNDTNDVNQETEDNDKENTVVEAVEEEEEEGLPAPSDEPKSEPKNEPAVVSQPDNATEIKDQVVEGMVAGAEDTAQVAAETVEEETLPKAGTDITSYLIVLIGLSGLAFLLKK